MVPFRWNVLLGLRVYQFRYTVLAGCRKLRSAGACESSNGSRFVLSSFAVETGGSVSDVAYVSKVKIERKLGPLRIAYLPGEPQPVFFSVHGAIAEHYKTDPEKIKESHASTIDYVIAATAG